MGAVACMWGWVCCVLTVASCCGLGLAVAWRLLLVPAPCKAFGLQIQSLGVLHTGQRCFLGLASGGEVEIVRSAVGGPTYRTTMLA